MDRKALERILDVQEMIQSDDVLMGEYESVQAAFLEMLPQLTEAQRDTLLDYLGVCVEIHLRMLEKAIEMRLPRGQPQIYHRLG